MLRAAPGTHAPRAPSGNCDQMSSMWGRSRNARHGFQSVTVKLAKDYDELRDVCRRHGIEISATRVRKVIRHFGAEKQQTRAWRRILEQTTGALLRQSAGE